MIWGCEKENGKKGATGWMGCAGMMRHQRKGSGYVENKNGERAGRAD